MANLSKLVTYRGDFLSAKIAYNREERKSLRKWKRDLLKVWNLRPITLWSGGYINDGVREALGIEENFLTSTKNLKWFGVELKPSINADKIIALNADNKDYLRDKCLDVFNKYGKKIKVAYSDSNSYDYKIFKNDIETDFEGEDDEELATLLYGRLIMYMVDNDSTDTWDRWSDVNPNSVDYWNGDARSSLKYFTYEFTNDDILKVVNDRLFVKRTYYTVKTTYDRDMGAGTETIRAYTIDTELANKLLDNGNVDNLILNYSSNFSWNAATKSYDINYTAVRNLPPREFMLFIQSHLDTFSKSKKKWYQSGLFGFLVVIAVVVIAVITQQYWLVHFGAELGTVLMVAGSLLSVTGAVIGNEVMVMGGQIVALVGAGVSVNQAFSAQEAMIETYTQQMIAAGVDQVAMTTAIGVLENELIINTLVSVGKLGLQAYSSFGGANVEAPLEEATTPQEELNIIYVAENEQWDFVNKHFPEYYMADTMKVM